MRPHTNDFRTYLTEGKVGKVVKEQSVKNVRHKNSLRSIVLMRRRVIQENYEGGDSNVEGLRRERR